MPKIFGFPDVLSVLSDRSENDLQSSHLLRVKANIQVKLV